MNAISIHADYRLALAEIKQRIQTTQTRAVLAANYELLSLYWYIGHKIVTLQQAQGWGGAVVEQMAADLQAEHPGIQGFSRTSLFAMRQFYLFLSPRFEVVPQAVGQLPWGHIRTEGMKALRNQLGVVEAEKFITLIRRDNFDYTEWQRDLWPDKSVEEVFVAAKEFSNYNPHTRRGHNEG